MFNRSRSCAVQRRRNIIICLTIENGIQHVTRSDKFWRNQNVMSDWTAEITGTGDRSEFKLETVLERSI